MSLAEAREAFQKGQDHVAEPLLQKLLLKNGRNPEIYQMLATISYNRGKFNKAIQFFKKAIEIDPSYTDACVGLSIILNDIGRYEEAKKVFVDAKKMLEQQKEQSSSWLDSKIANKHQELAELYVQSMRYSEALEQLDKVVSFAPEKKHEILLRRIDVKKSLGQEIAALNELKEAVLAEPYLIQLRLKLAQFYYETQQIAEAVEHWERVLSQDPQNREAQQKIRMAQTAGITQIGIDL